MNQMTFSDMEYSGRKRVTQKEKFLREMNEIIPWAAWVNKIQPYYPEGKRGRPPRGIEVMLRMYLLQIWFNLSDEGLEDAIYDSYAMRSFVGLNFLEEQVPDEPVLYAVWLCEPGHVYTWRQSKGVLPCLPWMISTQFAPKGASGKR